MSLIALPHFVTVRTAAGIDPWGILKKDVTEKTFKARITYAVDTRVAGKTTGQPVTNIIPTGSMILEVAAEFNHDDLLSFTATNGETYEVKVKKIKPINDFNAMPMYWKVTF